MGIPGKMSFDPQAGVLSMYNASGSLWWASNQYAQVWAKTRKQKFADCDEYTMIGNSGFFRCPAPLVWKISFQNGSWGVSYLPPGTDQPDPDLKVRWATKTVSGSPPYLFQVTDGGIGAITDANKNIVWVTNTTQTGALITNLQASSTNNFANTTLASIKSVLQQWQLPSDLVTKFMVAAYSQSSTVNSFAFGVRTGKASFSQYVGASLLTPDSTIHIAVAHVTVTGTPVQQYELVPTQKCHSCFFYGNCCTNGNSNVKRGFTQDELESMQLSMEQEGFQALSVELTNIV